MVRRVSPSPCRPGRPLSDMTNAARREGERRRSWAERETCMVEGRKEGGDGKGEEEERRGCREVSLTRALFCVRG